MTEMGTARKFFAYRLLSMIWLVLIALQWIDFTEPLWFSSTTSLVTITIIGIALIEVLLPLKAAWKWTVKILYILAIWRLVLTSFGVYVPAGPLFPDQLRDMALSFSPYIWFSLAAWALLEAAVRLIVNRRWILFFMSINLIAFAIIDSFTSYYLWSNVAWIVFAGLGWLVCYHLYEYRRKYPQGWQRLRRKPLKIAANIVLIFTCVLLIGISMPSVSPTLTDPYTAWKNRSEGQGGSGGTAKSKAAKKAVPTSSVQEEVLSGYSRDDRKLGNGFEFSYTPVMTVQSSVRSYWRGETRRIYSGKGWADLDEEPRETKRYKGAATSEPLEIEQPGKVEKREVEQIVTMNTNNTYPVLFGGYSIKSVELLDERQETPDMRWASREAEMFWNGYKRNSSKQPDYPQKYKVVAEIPVYPLEKLRQANYETLYKDEPDEDYLQLPSDLPQRVKDLAKQITAEGKTPYQKMELLQSYLSVNYEYTNKPDLSKKKSDDFVDSFLFEIKQGYCDYYSTSMVVMARSLGIPARWVKGYAPGSQPNNEAMMMRNPGMSGEYRVSNADAHSWAELYFGDYGWVPFEATPGFDAPILYTEEESTETMAPETPEETQTVKQEESFLSSIDPVILRRISAAAAAVLISWVLYQFRNELYFIWLRIRLGHALTPGEKTIFGTLRAVRKLRRKGLQRSDQETLREAFGRWKEERPQLKDVLSELLASFEKASYSPAAISTHEWRKVQQLSNQLVKLSRQRTTKG